MPYLYIIGGPNGAGKTTAAFSLLPDTFETIEFVNADEIARGISPLNPEAVSFHAGRIMLGRIKELLSNNSSLAFETTLSGLSYQKLIGQAKRSGYKIVLFFVYLNNYKLAKERVNFRVSKGGHNIPSDVIERRYKKGLLNFNSYAAMADNWYIYDNSGAGYLLVAKSIGNKREIYNFDVYNKITANSEKKENRRSKR